MSQPRSSTLSASHHRKAGQACHSCVPCPTIACNMQVHPHAPRHASVLSPWCRTTTSLPSCVCFRKIPGARPIAEAAIPSPPSGTIDNPGRRVTLRPQRVQPRMRRGSSGRQSTRRQPLRSTRGDAKCRGALGRHNVRELFCQVVLILRPATPGEVTEWPKVHDWKSCVRKRTAGSNPALSANRN